MGLLRRLTVVQKIFLGYSLTTLCFLLALGFSVMQLHRQARAVDSLVQSDFDALLAAGRLTQLVDAQDRLERGFLLTHEPTLLDLQQQRLQALAALTAELARTSVAPALPALLHRYRATVARGLTLQRTGQKKQWESLRNGTLTTERHRLQETLETLLPRLRQRIAATGAAVRKRGEQTVRQVTIIAVAGIALGLLLTVPVFWYIHRSIARLIGRSRDYGRGRFDDTDIDAGHDEFAQLTRAFGRMGRELEELQQLKLDANPLTHLPGNLAIQRELEQRLAKPAAFAHVYVDLDDFKAYNDRYGYQAGSAVIAETATLLRQSTQRTTADEAFVGHIGGDDYVVMTDPVRAEVLAQDFIVEFDRRAPFFYDEADRRAGHIVAHDRFGIERCFPLMTVSVAVVRSDRLNPLSPAAVSAECARLKHALKARPGSHYQVND